MTEIIELKRECDVIAIPSGQRQKLPLGTSVRIVQSRGGSYTVSTNFHAMYRIDAKDADALGLAAETSANEPAQQGPLTEKMVWDTLKTVFDPEIPVNIVDLGLVYSCDISAVEGGKTVSVRMAMTAPGCGMSNVLKADVESRLMRLPEVAKAEVEIVFDPPWTQDRMSDAARLQLGFDLGSPGPQKLTQIS
jgi:probable FeS assembly SUF system protein SufT